MNTSTIPIITTISDQFYSYLLNIQLPDLVATLIIGTIVTIAREIFYHYDAGTFKTSPLQVLFMIPVGWAGAIMGSEIANLSGGNQYSWLFTTAIAWVGGDALSKFSDMVIGLMEKGINAMGIDKKEEPIIYQKPPILSNTDNSVVKIELEPVNIEEKQEVFTKKRWYSPIEDRFFKVTQEWLAHDAESYPKTQTHPGVDFGTQGTKNVKLFFCADGEVIESGFHKSFGNYFFYFVESVNKTFVYFHGANNAPEKGIYKGGEYAMTCGETGLHFGIHLHLECINGRVDSAKRSQLYTSKQAIIDCSEDAYLFLKERIV